MEFVRQNNQEGNVCIINVTHCLQVGWVGGFNEILG